MLRKTKSELVDHLKSTFKKKQTRNPKYSMRSFSRDLGISHTILSRVLAGKRQPSAETIKTSASTLDDLTWEETAETVKAVHVRRVKKGKQTVGAFPLKYEIEALLSLTQTKGFKSDPVWIAKRLELSTSVVQAAIQVCIQLGWLRKTPQGNLINERLENSIDFDADDEDWRRYRQEILDRARFWVTSDRPDERVVSITEFAADSADLPKIEKRIEKMQFDLNDRAIKSKNGTELYCVMVCVFPLTKRK